MRTAEKFCRDRILLMHFLIFSVRHTISGQVPFGRFGIYGGLEKPEGRKHLHKRKPFYAGQLTKFGFGIIIIIDQEFTGGEI